MDSPQLSFFEDQPAPADTSTERRIVLHARPDRPLSKAQKAFNRLVARIEALHRRLEDERQRMEDALAYHGEHVQPRLRRLVAARAAVIRALGPFLDDRRVGKRDRRDLEELLAEQLDEVLARGEGPPDEDLRELFERIHGADLSDIEHAEMDDARAEMEAMFASIGLDVDLSEFRPGMKDEEIAAKMAELADQVRRQAEEHQERAAARPAPRKTKRQLQEEARAARYEELRRGSIGSIYRRLARRLHPDLEPDPDLRSRKSVVMQEVTAAHARNDLYALLRLELEWNLRDETDVQRLADEQLAAYNEMLKEQIADLEGALGQLPSHPRYAPLMTYLDPFGGRLRFDGPVEVQLLDGVIEALEASRVDLEGPQGLGCVRALLRERRAAYRVRY